jgi:hypothetical protein
MLLFLGLAAYAAARLFDGYQLRWLILLAGGLVGAAVIRTHVATLLVGAIVGGIFLARGPTVTGARIRRIAIMVAGVAAVAVVVSLATERLGLELSQESLDPFLNEIARRTDQGGSAVSGEPIISLGDVPQGVLRVMFRPLLFELGAPLAIASGLESTLLLLLFLWKLPRMVGNWRLLRTYPYLMTALLYVIGFIVVFSPVLNLGILTRQRTQVLPFFFALLVALGWGVISPKREGPLETPSAQPMEAR